jgi:hypothetical protein
MKVDLEQENLKEGLLGLVVAIIEILQEIMEHQALRKVEKGYLNDAEIDKLGNTLLHLKETIDQLKVDHELESSVEKIRMQLDQLVRFENFNFNKLN